uniref:G-protein coupled receptors family 1 profile domain-containing protein n=1 Tax=Plectus sambesii TaxID=2011161 RepID=A0A914W449_9BILA
MRGAWLPGDEAPSSVASFGRSENPSRRPPTGCPNLNACLVSSTPTCVPTARHERATPIAVRCRLSLSILLRTSKREDVHFRSGTRALIKALVGYEAVLAAICVLNEEPSSPRQVNVDSESLSTVAQLFKQLISAFAACLAARLKSPSSSMAGNGDELDFSNIISVDDFNTVDHNGHHFAHPFANNKTILCHLPDMAESDDCSRMNMPISSALWFKLLSASIYGLIAVLALIGNVVFCCVIWRSQKLHTVTHMLMTNLGICNLLFLLFHPAFFMNTYIFQTSWNLGVFVCKASFSTVYVTATASFYFMSLVAIDRWLAVFRRKLRLDKRKCLVMTLFVWVGSFTIASPYLYFTNTISVNTDSMADRLFDLLDGNLTRPRRHMQCGIDCDSACKHVLQIVSVIAQYCVPLLIMIPTYAHLAIFLWRRPDVGAQTKEKHHRSQQRKRKTLLILLAIVGSLVVCWSPLFSIGLLHSYGVIDNINSMALFIVTSVIALVAVMLTPLLYLMNDSFRNEVLRLLRCCIDPNHSEVNGRSTLARCHRDPSTWADDAGPNNASQRTTASQSADKIKQSTPLLKRQNKRRRSTLNRSIEESSDWGGGWGRDQLDVIELDVHFSGEETKTTAVRSSEFNSLESTDL